MNKSELDAAFSNAKESILKPAFTEEKMSELTSKAYESGNFSAEKLIPILTAYLFETNVKFLYKVLEMTLVDKP